MSDKTNQDDARIERGVEVLRRIGGTHWNGPIGRVAETSADFADLVVAFPYGDVLSRPGLDLRTRQICTISSIMAQGSAQAQLRFHMEGLLNVGGDVQDLIEVLFLSTVVLGFPIAIDAVAIVRGLLKDRATAFVPTPNVEVSPDERRRRGAACLVALLQEDEASYTSRFTAIAPAIGEWIIDFEFGDIFARPALGAHEKQLAIITMLATVGNRTDRLNRHIRGSLAAGLSKEQVIEALIQLSVYAGFPAALNAFAAAREAFEERSPVPASNAFVPGRPPESGGARRERGLATLAATSGASGDAVVHSFDDMAPEIGALIVEHCYGDIFSRPGLDPKTRELTACAALCGALTVACETPLKVHVVAALTLGATRAEVTETLLNVLPYRGYPAVERALLIAGEAFAEQHA